MIDVSNAKAIPFTRFNSVSSDADAQKKMYCGIINGEVLISAQRNWNVYKTEIVQQ